VLSRHTHAGPRPIHTVTLSLDGELVPDVRPGAKGTFGKLEASPRPRVEARLSAGRAHRDAMARTQVPFEWGHPTPDGTSRRSHNPYISFGGVARDG
jgi:hypothetical protein